MFLRIGIASVVVAILGIFLSLLIFAVGRRAALAVDLRNQLLTAARNLESLVFLRTESREAKRYGDILAKTLPDRSKLFEFMRVASVLGRERDVEVSILITGETLGTPTSAGGVSFDMTARGKLEDIFAFINAVHKSGYLVNFSSFELTNGGASLSEASLAGSVFTR